MKGLSEPWTQIELLIHARERFKCYDMDVDNDLVPEDHKQFMRRLDHAIGNPPDTTELDAVKAKLAEMHEAMKTLRGVSRRRNRAEDADCVEHWLDDQKAPKCDTYGGSFSLVGRIKSLMSKFESFDNQWADNNKNLELAMGDAMKEIESRNMPANNMRDGDVSGINFESFKDMVFFYKIPGTDYGRIEKIRGVHRIHTLSHRHWEGRPDLEASDLRTIADKLDELNGIKTITGTIKEGKS